jgi:tripartite-type tricarboxylate transporter receptor subunit TctC
VPALGETGLAGYDCSGWWGVLVPAATPKDIIGRLNTMIHKAVNASEMQDTLTRQGFEPLTGTPEQLAARIQREIVQNAKLVKIAGLTPE